MTQPADTKNTILILGASYAGLSINHYLLKHAISSLPNHQIVLVGASKDVMCRPACPRAMISDDFFDQDKLFVDISKQLEQYPKDRWSFIHGTATQVDHENRTATIKHNNDEMQETTIPFHALVIATGASTPSPLLSNSPSLRDAWKAFRTTLPSATSIVIAGSGPSGVEVAGELGSYLNGRRASSQRQVAITLIASGAHILPTLRPAIAITAEQYLAKLGVTVINKARVVGVEAGNITLSTGAILTADIYIPATGASPNTSFLSPHLLAPDGRVTTDPQTLRVDTRIYALGDCSTAFRPAIHNIIAAVPVLGENIKRDLLGASGDDKLFLEDTRETQLVPIGMSKGVGAAMGWRLPSWLVWVIKGRDYWVWTTGRLWSGRQW